MLHEHNFLLDIFKLFSSCIYTYKHSSAKNVFIRIFSNSFIIIKNCKQPIVNIYWYFFFLNFPLFSLWEHCTQVLISAEPITYHPTSCDYSNWPVGWVCDPVWIDLSWPRKGSFSFQVVRRWGCDSGRLFHLELLEKNHLLSDQEAARTRSGAANSASHTVGKASLWRKTPPTLLQIWLNGPISSLPKASLNWDSSSFNHETPNIWIQINRAG